MTDQEKEVIFIHHGLVDAVMRIVANLFLIEQINKNGEKIFRHDGIRLELNSDLVVLGLERHLKDYFIEEHGEREGLNKAFSVIRAMYIESNSEPIALTQAGREALEDMFIGVIEDIQTEEKPVIH